MFRDLYWATRYWISSWWISWTVPGEQPPAELIGRFDVEAVVSGSVDPVSSLLGPISLVAIVEEC